MAHLKEAAGAPHCGDAAATLPAADEVTIRLEILPVKFVLHDKKVDEPIKSLDRTVRLSVCSENRKSLGCLERFDYYITTWFAKMHSVRRRSARKITTQIGLF
jgi:hypothetical protein